MKRFAKNVFNVLILSSVLFSMSVQSNDLAAISVKPTRVILDKNSRHAAITLRNSSTGTFTYRMRFVEMGLSKEGRLHLMKPGSYPDGFRSAANVVRVSPRQVRLGPGESQVVRLMMRRGSVIEPGEYRSHLEIRALPKLSESDLAEVLKKKEATGQLAPIVNARVGVTLPVILRSGDLDASVDIQKAAFLKSSTGNFDLVKFKLKRNGSQSVFGDIRMYWETSEGGDSSPQLIANVEGYGLYYPYQSEDILLKTNPLKKEMLELGGKLKVVFSNDEILTEQSNWVDKWLDWEFAAER